MTLVDAHIHLPAYGGDAGPLRVALARSMCLISCTVNASEAPAGERSRLEAPRNVRSFVGVHPSDVTRELPSERLAPFLEGCDGIGEIGLDEKYSTTSDGGAQMEAFIDQLRVAERLGKPVQVHSRGSEKRCLEVLGTFNLKKVLMHWFEGEPQLPEVIARGYFVSVGPALLYSKKIRRIARSLTPGSILTESDGPVSYGPLGGANGPNLIPSVLFGLAAIRGETYDDLERRVGENAKAFLSEERLI